VLLTQWQIFTEFSRKIPGKFNIATCTNAQLSIFATALIVKRICIFQLSMQKQKTIVLSLNPHTKGKSKL